MCSSPRVAKRGLLIAVFPDNEGDQVIMHLSIAMILLTRGLSLINNVTYWFFVKVGSPRKRWINRIMTKGRKKQHSMSTDLWDDFAEK